MRKIRLNTTTSKNGEGIPYAFLISQCLHAQQPNQPIPLEEQRRRFRVMDALEEAGDEVFFLLEDEDASTLERCVRDMPWGSMSREFVEFSDDVIADCKAKYTPASRVDEVPGHPEEVERSE